MALINETNQQYYAGAQGFTVQDAAGQQDFTFTFDTNLVFGDGNIDSKIIKNHITIPFEDFVFYPDKYITRITKLLKTNISLYNLTQELLSN